MDWGMFHVKHDFITHWRRYQKLLKHRNALLKEGMASYDQFEPWDQQMQKQAHIIDQSRREYVKKLESIIGNIARDMGLSADIKLNYQPGWQGELASEFKSHYEQDRYFKFTSKGPHRADTEFAIDGHNALSKLSRGQQKIFVIILKLAQGQLLQTMTGAECVFLIDDLPSELDEQNIQRVLRQLQQYHHQIFITTIDSSKIISQLSTSNNCQVIHMAGH
jgi:DNA replication and repair protein RecF